MSVAAPADAQLAPVVDVGLSGQIARSGADLPVPQRWKQLEQRHDPKVQD
jgi:hypothetical protein